MSAKHAQGPFNHDPDIGETENSRETTSASSESLPYSAFSISQKIWIIALVGFAGWFSSLSSFIYFPAIPSIASDLDVSIERINLSVTAYLIMSGIFPSIVGNAADTLGRRPVFIVTLALYVGAKIGLALQSSFGLLFFLRMVQSAGISGSYSVTYGVLGDLFTPSERGGYSGIVSFFLNTPPSVGPVISGLLMSRWGWRSIFWFLAAISPCCLLAILLFLPETSRQVVGDGRIVATGANRVFFSFLSPSNLTIDRQIPISKGRSCQIPKPWESLVVLGRPGTAIVIGSFGVYYTLYTCLQASLSSLFVQIYHTSGLVSGLTYLPFGVACAISAFAAGRILDAEYRSTAFRHNIPVDQSKDHNLVSFPVEEARLRIVKYFLVVCCFLVIGYGWSLQYRAHMAVPLVLQFFIGLTIQVFFTSASILLVDLHPECPATTQAANNFVRCEMSAGMLALLDLLLGKLGPGWYFVLFAALALLTLLPLYLLEMKGMSWRQKRSKSATNDPVEEAGMGEGNKQTMAN
ncbi:hypothetical protein PENVUL_c041G04369 [Penicillium vulpinum]|uniref:Major facilitator superfamily (MFS) profile domain-containing protein n=1 Tax=Penicillium vulpinum TaxID=29845 RepID=A0A1V6RJV7_9EURO|nr:hypothetical protein PENVUL_c041G04369 [Penicillium vulpinum]